jgi:hypothetical protein
MLPLFFTSMVHPWQHLPSFPLQISENEYPTYTPICARLSAATRSVSPKACLKALEAIWVYLFQLLVPVIDYKCKAGLIRGE